MNTQPTEIAKARKSSNQRPVRTRTVSTRVTEAQYAALQEQAWSAGKTVCDWARECIVQQLEKSPRKRLGEHLFTELVGIQLLLINTLGPILRGQRMPAEQVDAIFREVQARKARKAQELLNKRASGELEPSGATQAHSSPAASA